MTAGPIAAYTAEVEAGEIQHDDAQYMAAGHLQRLFDELVAETPPVRERGWLGRLLGGPPAPAPSVRGLYLWGGVGRGKTYVMDLFFAALPFEAKVRTHFHRFMREVHRELRQLQGQANPLDAVAERFAAKARVICFDEFFVSDITDAMILAGLLEALFKRGVTLVTTSNVEPKDLYRDGLQRGKFLPAIALLERHTEVVNVDGGYDYRLRALKLAEIYHCPLDEGADASLEQSFRSLSPDQGEAGVVLEIEGRPIATVKCGDGVAWFAFAELCDGPRSQNDYIELARIFQTIIVGGVPVFDVTREDQARRFISLVDEFYDRNVKLILSAAAEIDSLYQGTRLRFEFERTASRLLEMRSHEYLGREHKA